MGRASMLLSEPPVNPHIEAATRSAQARKENALAQALAIEPVVSAATDRLLMSSMAFETGAIIPSTQAWKVAERKAAAAEPEPEPALTADDEVAAIRASMVRRASVGSAATGGEWWSAHGSSDGGFSDATVSGARGGSAPCGPVAWWPQTCVFKRRDSLVTLMNDKSISSDERKAKRATRSRERERSAASAAANREPLLHVKHYGKMCLVRSDQKLAFRDSETFPVVDTYHHPLRDRSLAELRERDPGLRPENLDHNSTIVIRASGESTANPAEQRRTPKHAALYHAMAALPDLPNDARPVTVPSTLMEVSQAMIGGGGPLQPSLSLAYVSTAAQSAGVACGFCLNLSDSACLYLIDAGAYPALERGRERERAQAP